ncbi:MAG: hypothetical protein IPP71_06605 [Bacteroidetes bacterium]|nr:hypothetical protein [Bacteroidota bacterium]
MKNLYAKMLLVVFASAMLLPISLLAQNEKQHFDKCLAEIMYKEQMATNPEFRKNQQLLELETQNYVNQRSGQNTTSPGQKTPL